MALSTRYGLVPGEYFRKHRKVSYIVLYLLAVLLVPTDIFTQILLFLPLMGMYETGIGLAKWFGTPDDPMADHTTKSLQG